MALFEQYVTLLERQFGKRFENVRIKGSCIGIVLTGCIDCCARRVGPYVRREGQ